MSVTEQDPSELEAEASVDLGHTRRALVAALGAGALLGLARKADAQAGGSGNLTPAQLRLRLLRRTSYGPLPQEVSKATGLGYDAYLDYQLAYEAIDDTASEAAASYYSTINFPERDLFKLREDAAKADLAEATMVRAILSQRQLYQRMVEFWTDHFNVYFDKVGVLKVVHDRDVIRKHALGNFRDMLMANTKSPATLVYLDNNSSSKESPNQNLAREMMELHSIGVDGGYTQNDVINVSRCLTGWTVRLWPYDATDVGKFLFDRYAHYNATKIVLGRTIASGGWVTDGETVVRILAGKRATGQFLAKKLCRFFLGYEPGTALVESIADIYMATGGEIKPMVKAVLSQENMMVTGLMVKRPFHYAMGLLRQSQAQIANASSLRDVLSEMGQHPFDWAPPNGYPHAQPYWTGGLLARWNYAFALFSKEIEHVTVNRNTIMKNAVLLEDVLTRINVVFFNGEMNGAAKTLLRAALVSDTSALGRSMNACAMAATLPGYQEC